MATARPFAYNPGSLIPGTEQLGSLSIGFPSSGLTDNPQYWNGPDEDLGYVIAQSVPGNTQPTPLSGVTASVGFFRSPGLTIESFITLSETIAGRSFSSGSQAKTWLNDNGYWTSYNQVPNSYFFFVGDGQSPQQPNNAGDLMFVDDNFLVTYDWDLAVGLYINITDSDGVSHSDYLDLETYGGTITMVQDTTTVILSGTNTCFQNIGGSIVTSVNTDTIQSGVFVSGLPIIVFVQVNYPVTPTPTVTPTRTPSVTSTPTPTPTPFAPNTYFFRYSEGEPVTLINENGDLEFGFEGSVTFNPNNMDTILVYDIDKSGLSHPEYQDAPTYGAVITMTQGSNSVVLSAGTQGEASEWVYISGFNILQSNNPVLITPSANPFVFNSPISLVVTVNYP